MAISYVCSAAGKRACGKTDGFGAGNARFADFEDRSARADARMGHRAANPPGVEGCAAGESGGPLSGFAPVGSEWMDTGGMGGIGEQPPGKILFADQERPEIYAGGRGELGQVVGGDWLGVED